jgi:DNA-3-methyladenine glycosylase I
MRPALLHSDGKMRCPWPGTDPFYVAYHDTDWGVPELDDRALFEKLILDGFQAGLSWITILRKRERFREVFDGFDAAKIVRYDQAKIESLMADAGIVRNRSKIEATVRSAAVYLDLMEKGGFSAFLWRYLEGRPIQNRFVHMEDVPVETALSQRISKDLGKLGFRFCGPTIIYAFMQAVGMVNDHLVGCYRHEECAALGRATG